MSSQISDPSITNSPTCKSVMERNSLLLDDAAIVSAVDNHQDPFSIMED